MIRLFLSVAAMGFAALATCAQDAAPAEDPFVDAENPFVPADTAEAETEWVPLHPDGDTPRERMLSLAHTDALPRFDRLELYAVSLPKPFSDEAPKREPSDKTFPVRPYGIHADILAHKTITGDACDQLRDTWRSLSFDRLGGAMCHDPVYGLRMYRGNQLLFETTVCWKCQNFYVPQYDADEQRRVHGWYGFSNDDAAQALLKQIQTHLPHPKL